MTYNNESLKMIEDLSNAKGPSGFEDEVLEVARKYTEGLFDIEEDKVRNIYFKLKSNTGNRPLIMLDAHSDEVGFMVHSIRPNGTIRVVNLGGWTLSSLPSSKVLVRNSLGKWISGVFVNIPKHFKNGNDGADLKISDLSIDVGATSDKEAKEVFKIRMGEPIVPATKFEFIEETGLIFGKAFDCRIGCAALIDTLKLLNNMKLDCDVIGVLSSQEEVGERGCKVSVNHVKPDVALCYEGCPCDDTFTENYAIQTALKKGPMFRHMDCSMIASPRLQRFVLDLAEKKNMPCQESVREGGGNDAAITIYSNQGVPSVTAGIPVRYIHSMNCITSYQDYEYTVNLMTEIVKNLNKDIIDKF